MNCQLQAHAMCVTIRVMTTVGQERHQMVTDVKATTSGCSAGPGQALEEASGSGEEHRGKQDQGGESSRALRGIKQTCAVYQNVLPLSEYNKQLCAQTCKPYV